MRDYFLVALIAYLCGSIPFGYILIRIFRGQDIRATGSGNIGATNVARTAPALGAATLLLDGFKGFLPVHAVLGLGISHDAQATHLERMLALAALFAVLGHLFPIWLKFRGGKGVATALGAFLRFSATSVLVAIIIFFVVALTSRRISMGSIVTAALFPIIACFFLPRDAWTVAFISIAGVLIIARHHHNIRRLLSGQEPRFSLGRK